MPNWVTNKLYVVGPAQDIAEFKAKSRDSYFPANEKKDNRRVTKKRSKPVVVDLSFDRMVPIPLEVIKKPEIKLKDGFYEHPTLSWCIKHWGCKWDASNPKLIRESKRRLYYIFYTPWNPPYEWLKRVSKQYPRLHFSVHYWDSAPRVIIWAIKGELWGKRKKS